LLKLCDVSGFDHTAKQRLVELELFVVDLDLFEHLCPLMGVLLVEVVDFSNCLFVTHTEVLD
jgi:hypothetical protein